MVAARSVHRDRLSAAQLSQRHFQTTTINEESHKTNRSRFLRASKAVQTSGCWDDAKRRTVDRETICRAALACVSPPTPPGLLPTCAPASPRPSVQR